MAVCIKTGACVLIEEYGTYLVCDLYEIDQEDGHPIVVAYAVSQPAFDPPRKPTHRIRIGRGWFKNRTGDETTLVVPRVNVAEL